MAMVLTKYELGGKLLLSPEARVASGVLIQGVAVEQLVARQAHNLKVAGSNPARASKPPFGGSS